MKKVLVINGANLNMLGIREVKIYGGKSYFDLVEYIVRHAKKADMEIECFQSNFEGEIVEKIQKAYNKFEGIIINAGGYTHTSVAILDALKAVSIPTVEVHLSDIGERESFRNFSYIALYAEKTVIGKGFEGYGEALDYLSRL